MIQLQLKPRSAAYPASFTAGRFGSLSLGSYSDIVISFCDMPHRCNALGDNRSRLRWFLSSRQLPRQVLSAAAHAELSGDSGVAEADRSTRTLLTRRAIRGCQRNLRIAADLLRDINGRI
jgi:hypothetical protein